MTQNFPNEGKELFSTLTMTQQSTLQDNFVKAEILKNKSNSIFQIYG